MPLAADLMGRLSKLLKALWLFLAGVVAVFLIYYLFTGVEQGIDVVIRSGEVLTTGILSVLSVFLWSFLVWYSCRMLSYIKQHKDDEIFSKRTANDHLSPQLYHKYCIPTAYYKHIPRMLAYNCFVSIQVAIFHLPTFFDWSGAVMLVAILLQNLFYFSLVYGFQSLPGSQRRKVLGRINVFLIALYAGFLIYLLIVNGKGIDLLRDPLRHTFWLALIALVMFLLQVVIVFLFVQRRRRIDALRNAPDRNPSEWLSAIGFHPGFNAAEAPYFKMLNATAVVAIAVYVCGIFWMRFAGALGPMAFSLLALGVLTGFSNLVTLVSIRSSFNVMIVLLVAAAIFGQYRDPYSVRFLSTGNRTAYSERPSVNEYLGKWFGRRLEMLDKQDTTTTFPVYIVLSNGGASRAGRWTSSVLSHLQDSSYRLNPDDSFKDHVLCIAGASGGTVGNSVFYSLLKASEEGKISAGSFGAHADAYFEADFLTFTLARLLGPDMFRHLVPFNIPLLNRADALEETIAGSSKDTLLNGYFSKPFSEVMDTTGALPIFLINTTQVDNGMPGVISTAKLANSQRQDVLALADSMDRLSGEGDMRFSTVAVLSSRFPYVSPAGKVFDRYYVDGGYFDNSGAGTVLEVINTLNRFLSDTTPADILRYRDRFTFHILHITNAEILQRPSGDVHPLTNDLLSPILTLAGMQGASTSIGDGILVNAFRQFNADTTNAMIIYSLYDETWDLGKNEGVYEEGYPMSWMLSHYQRARMDVALRRATQRNRGKFDFSHPDDER